MTNLNVRAILYFHLERKKMSDPNGSNGIKRKSRELAKKGCTFKILKAYY